MGSDHLQVLGKKIDGGEQAIDLSVGELLDAVEQSTQSILAAIRGVVEEATPQMVTDVAENGILLSGGGSLVGGLRERISRATRTATTHSEDPMNAVIIGLGGAPRR